MCQLEREPPAPMSIPWRLLLRLHPILLTWIALQVQFRRELPRGCLLLKAYRSSELPQRGDEFRKRGECCKTPDAVIREHSLPTPNVWLTPTAMKGCLSTHENRQAATSVNRSTPVSSGILHRTCRTDKRHGKTPIFFLRGRKLQNFFFPPSGSSQLSIFGRLADCRNNRQK